MGKNRIVKNDPFVCEKLFEAEQSSGLPLRIAFVGITRHADREGRFEWRPRAIKLDALPYDDLDFSAILDLLLAAGFLEKYDVAGRLYGTRRDSYGLDAADQRLCEQERWFETFR